MKKLLNSKLVLIFSLASFSQDPQIETESVILDNFISFIVEHYNTQTDSTATRHITFLIETYAERFNSEDGVILKQAFKLLSKRLTAKDSVSIIAYSNYNGSILAKTGAKDLKKLLYAIEHPKPSIIATETDGIDLAYQNAKAHFVKAGENSVVMLRIPNRKDAINKEELTNTDQSPVEKKGNAVVLTAISLLPELIAIIKD